MSHRKLANKGKKGKGKQGKGKGKKDRAEVVALKTEMSPIHDLVATVTQPI